MTEINKNYCRVCINETKFIFKGILIEVPVKYYECLYCGYIQTESPYWLDKAYSKAINDSDTGIMARNQINAKIVLAAMWIIGGLNNTLVDYAGGYGILVRLLRDFGVNALWTDRFCQNLLAGGFEHNGEKAVLVTAFEAFEHFVNPAQELDRLLRIAPNILFSTELISDPAPKQDEWWYYGKDHGQHIGFFRLRTLEKLAFERGKYLVSNGHSCHMMTDKPVNPNLWKILIRANRIIPFLLRGKLVSKIWSDHNLIARVNK